LRLLYGNREAGQHRARIQCVRKTSDPKYLRPVVSSADASMSNGLFARVRRTASRNASMCRVRRSARLFSRLIVKKLGAAGDSVAAIVRREVILARGVELAERHCEASVLPPSNLTKASCGRIRHEQFRAARGLRPLVPAKGKWTNRKASVDVLGETKTNAAFPVIGDGAPIAERRANVPRQVAPGAAPQHAPAAVTTAGLQPG
jgi:hypothetical protein